MEIPQEYQDFCKEVGRIARKYGLENFRGTFRPRMFENDWHSDIDFTWDQGRHGIERDNIAIHSQVWVNTKIDEEDVKEK